MYLGVCPGDDERSEDVLGTLRDHYCSAVRSVVRYYLWREEH